MTVIGHGADLCTYTTRPASPSIGSIIYQTDTDEYLKYVSYGGTNRWMQAQPQSGRNVLSNGQMQVWQRGTSVSNMGPSRTYAYSADRWESYRGAFQTNITVSRQTGTGQFGYCARVQRVNGDTATQYLSINQALESADSLKFSGKYATLGFWARIGANFSSSLSNKLSCAITSGTGTDQNARGGFTGAVQVAGSDITLSTSWAYYSITGLVGTINQIAVNFNYVPTGTAGANDWFEITGVQLEVGSAPSTFEFLSYQNDLNICERYFKYYGGIYMANAWDNDYGRQLGHVNFPVTMRIAPDTTVLAGGMDGHHGTAPSAYNSGVNHAYFNWSGAAIREPSAAAWASFYVSADL